MRHRFWFFFLGGAIAISGSSIADDSSPTKSVKADAYTPIQATQRIADRPRKLHYQPSWGRKFSGDETRPAVTLTNPYLDPGKVPFLSMSAMQCTADGGLIVSGSTDADANARALGTGFWKVAPDGALTPLHARGTRSQAKTARTLCEAPFGKTNLV